MVNFILEAGLEAALWGLGGDPPEGAGATGSLAPTPQ